MNDAAIRPLLYPLLIGGVHIDELPTGNTRADVVHITPAFMHGYELKGDSDTLKRVPNQLRCYGQAYDLVSFVVTEKHVPGVQVLLPEWAGILVASEDGITPLRPAMQHNQVRRRNLAFLLLAEEVKLFLKARGEKGLSRLRNHELGSLLAKAEHIPLLELGAFVRQRLIDRLPQGLQRRERTKQER
ncbi:sce7726 family protein [Hymenobacter sp. J193]|uniref:sce7726 family protein n=1 Tax=Hymenobacter sp. J193 TaxID=2898429 RepID=UPI002150D93B|nr:sce7726 family protein [Hymenobacter sp. J193]MCR5890374.1 sce7726 family protein [Hymenobacter sp. J193]